jgi:hypothetical protein
MVPFQFSPEDPNPPDLVDSPDLLAQNQSKLRIWIALNLALFWFAWTAGTAGFDPTLAEIFAQLTVEDSVFMVLSPILVLVLNGLFSDHMKAVLVFRKRKDPLPGTRFVDLALEAQDTINLDALLENLRKEEPPPPELKGGDWPKDPKEKNRLWYRIYRAHQMDELVAVAHARWLATRDLAALSFLFLCLFSVACIIQSAFFGLNWIFTLVYIALLILFFVGISGSARVYGNAFVLRVLTEELYQE